MFGRSVGYYAFEFLRQDLEPQALGFSQLDHDVVAVGQGILHLADGERKTTARLLTFDGIAHRIRLLTRFMVNETLPPSQLMRTMRRICVWMMQGKGSSPRTNCDVSAPNIQGLVPGCSRASLFEKAAGTLPSYCPLRSLFAA